VADGSVVVTGAASGIGRRAAVLLARAGRHVVVVARSHVRAAAAVEEARAAIGPGGGRVTSVAADLAEVAQTRRAVEEIVALGPVRAVVNNAAVLAVARRRPRLTVDGIEEVFAVNHVAAFVLTRGLLDHLTPDGRVVIAGSKGLAAMPWLRLDLDDLDSRNRWSAVRAYYRSKIAQLTFTAELGRRGVPAAALRIPSVRIDDDRLAAYPRLLQLAYRPKQRLAADPARVAAAYVALVDRADPARGHVDERGRSVRWPNRSGDPWLAEQVWAMTTALAA
jgi:NAD(P)-dependent dehydrogenase (short-subunit alcohol dehydrogenase family)